MYVKAVSTKGPTGLQVLFELGGPEDEDETVLRLLRAWRNGQPVSLEVEAVDVDQLAEDEDETEADPETIAAAAAHRRNYSPSALL